MNGADSLLAREALTRVMDAIERAQIDCDDVLTALPANVRAYLPKGSSPKAELFLALHRLNGWFPLEGDDLPLRIALEAARELIGPRRERRIVDEALVDLLDGPTLKRDGGPHSNAQEFFYRRACDSFEASGCKVVMSASRAETFIAYRGHIAQVVAVCVDSPERAIRVVKLEMAQVQRFELHVEGLVVLPFGATAEHRKTVEISDLRVVDARDLKGMDIDDVESVVRAQFAQHSEVACAHQTVLETAYRLFQNSDAQLMMVSGPESEVQLACRRFFCDRAVELLDGVGACAPLWLPLAEPLPPTVEELAMAHFRKNGVRCSSLGLRLMLKDHQLLPVFEAGPSIPRRRATALVHQAVSQPARAVVFSALNQLGGPDPSSLRPPNATVQTIQLPSSRNSG